MKNDGMHEMFDWSPGGQGVLASVDRASLFIFLTVIKRHSEL